jgi:hypothetical protein
MMKKKPTRKYAVGGMTPTQTDKVNAANMAAMQKANAAGQSLLRPTQAALSGATPNVRPATAVPQKPTPVGPPRPVPAVPTTKEKAQYLKAARGISVKIVSQVRLKRMFKPKRKTCGLHLRVVLFPKKLVSLYVMRLKTPMLSQ